MRPTLALVVLLFPSWAQAQPLTGLKAPFLGDVVRAVSPQSGGGSGGGLSSPISGDYVATGKWTFGTAAGAANTVAMGETAGHITWEGAADDAAEARVVHNVNAGFDTITTIPALGTTQTVAMITQAQSFTGVQTFGSGISTTSITTASGDLSLNPTGGVALATSKYIYSVSAGAANSVMYGGANGTDRGMFFPSNGVGFSASGFVRMQIEDAAKTLTESAATSVVQVGVASDTMTGGSVEYTVEASDATDHQARAGKVFFQFVNKAGTETCVVSGTAGNVNPTEAQDGSSPAVSAGTLTYTWGVSTTPTNACDLTLNAVSSLTQTILRITYTVIKSGGAGAITPQ